MYSIFVELLSFSAFVTMSTFYYTDGSFVLPGGAVCYAGVVPDSAVVKAQQARLAAEEKAHNSNVDAQNARVAADQARRESERKLKAMEADAAAKRAELKAKLNARIAELRDVRTRASTAFKAFDLKKRRGDDAFHPLLQKMVKKGVLTLTKPQLEMLRVHFPVVSSELSRWCAANWPFANNKDGDVPETDIPECCTQIGLCEALLRAFFTSVDALRTALPTYDAPTLLLVEYWCRAVAAAWARLHADAEDALEQARAWLSLAEEAGEKHSAMEFPPLTSSTKASKPKGVKPQGRKPKVEKPKVEKPTPAVAGPTSA